MPLPIQNRIILGITFFVGIMLLVGWIAINEGGRMSVFTDQYNGRSIENGAVIFQNNCSTCHNIDGKGQTGRAPALLNPMLFADSNPAIDQTAKIADLQKQLDAANGQVADIAGEQGKLTALQTQLAAATNQSQKDSVNAQIANLQSQMTRDQANVPTVQKSATDLQAQIDAANVDLKKLTDAGWDPNRQPRLKEISWGGTLQSYIADAVAAGRPLSGSYWGGNIMPTWGQTFGGPLRPDEVDDVTNYVLNFRDTALKLTPKDVAQQFALPQSQGAGPNPSPNVDPKEIIFTKFGKQADNSVANLGDLSGGDAANGEKLYTSLACAGCHLAGAVGPITKGTFYRAVTVRIKEPSIAAQKLTAEQYLAQSILYPQAYIAPGGVGLMPATFGSQLTLPQLKDLIAYLKTQNVP